MLTGGGCYLAGPCGRRCQPGSGGGGDSSAASPWSLISGRERKFLCGDVEFVTGSGSGPCGHERRPRGPWRGWLRLCIGKKTHICCPSPALITYCLSASVGTECSAFANAGGEHKHSFAERLRPFSSPSSFYFFPSFFSVWFLFSLQRHVGQRLIVRAAQETHCRTDPIR